MRIASKKDIPVLEGYLSNYSDTSMFLRSNLARFGIENTQDDAGSTYWIYEQGNEIKGVFGLTNKGYAMLQAPNVGAHFWGALKECLLGLKILGVTGVPLQVKNALEALELSDVAFNVNHASPLYRAKIDDIVTFENPSFSIRMASAQDSALLSEWFMNFLIDTGTKPQRNAARIEGEMRAKNAINNPDVWLLCQNGTPVSMAAINASVTNIVQIGGVYTPPNLRCQGFARRAVSHMLMRRKAAKYAILFAANRIAAKAYVAIGFQYSGSYQVSMFRDAQVIGEKR